MDVADRVQIAPLGYNTIVFSSQSTNITQILSFYSVTKRSRTTKHRFSAISCRHLEKNDRIELKERECDLFDINSAVTAFVNVIEAHQKDDVLVNLSTGSKLTAIGG